MKYLRPLKILQVSYLSRRIMFSTISSNSDTLDSLKMDKLIAIVDALNVPKAHLNTLVPFLNNGVRVGLVTPMFCEILTTHASTTFELTQNNQLQFTQPLHDSSNVQKSKALNEVNLKLRDLGIIKGWRNEFLTVSDSFSTMSQSSRTDSATTLPTTDSSTYATTDITPLLIERAAYPFYGINAYGIHVNGFTRDRVTKRVTGLWIAKRSMNKSTWPGVYCCMDVFCCNVCCLFVKIENYMCVACVFLITVAS